jgi:uncharacterized membrane protein YphA (DoxX/SURF4 family)
VNTVKNTSKTKEILFWITTLIIAIAYFITGLGNLLPFAHIAQDMAHLGYPTYFLKILGVWKIFAAIVTVIPGIRRIKEWAFAGMMLDLSGAALSRYFSGDAWPTIFIPIAISILVTVNYVIRITLLNKSSSSSTKGSTIVGNLIDKATNAFI